MKMRGHIAARRSCILHGDNGCEIQGEAGSVTRALEKRLWRREVDNEIDDMPAEPSGTPVVKDSRDYALIVMVDFEGKAEANAVGVSHEKAASWLRAIAELWDPQ